MEKMNEIRRKSMEERGDQNASQTRSKREDTRERRESSADSSVRVQLMRNLKCRIQKEGHRHSDNARVSKKKTATTAPKAKDSASHHSFNDGIRVRASKPDSFTSPATEERGDHEGIRVGPQPRQPQPQRMDNHDGIRVEAMPAGDDTATMVFGWVLPPSTHTRPVLHLWHSQKSLMKLLGLSSPTRWVST